MAASIVKTLCPKVMALHRPTARLPQSGIPMLGMLCAQPSLQSKRHKHYHPDFRRHRWAKYVKIDLPDFDEMRANQKMTPEEKRSKDKKDKVPYPRSYREREIVIASTSSIFDPFVPTEGDGRVSVLSGGASQTASEFGKKGKSLVDQRKIKKYEENFDRTAFCHQAQDIYIEAHELMNDLKANEEKLHDFVTEHAFPMMTNGLHKKTVRWRFVESLEPARVICLRTSSLITKDNVYAQVTVRFHTRQSLSIYDRFGRLMYGGERLIKDCLEYVVFEKHLSDEYGRWRLHDKIKPDWMPAAEPVLRTLRKPDMEEEEYVAPESSSGSSKDDSSSKTDKLAKAV